MFGLFKKSPKAEPPKPEPRAEAPPTAIVPVTADETQLAQLGPILWQDVRYGMTPEEVKGLRADAARSTKVGKLNDGATVELSIPHLKLGTHDYSVEFYFKAGLLTQVTIATNGGPEMSDFRDLTNALRLRYGQEVSMEESADSFSMAEWLSSDGINVSVAFYAGIDVLNVNFQYRYADTARQL